MKRPMDFYNVINYTNLYYYATIYLTLYINLSFARLLAPRAYPTVGNKTRFGLLEQDKWRRWKDHGHGFNRGWRRFGGHDVDTFSAG
jgi:hypothetical protein